MKHPRECQNVKRKVAQKGLWSEEYKWKSDTKNLKLKNDKKKYKWKVIKKKNFKCSRRRERGAAAKAEPPNLLV